MSERIGDYIHFRYKNYIKYGTTIDRSSPPANDVIKRHQELLRRFVNSRTKKSKQSIKQHLENQLNFFFGAKGSIESLGYDAQEQQQIQQIITTIFQSAMQNLKPGMALQGIDWNTLSAWSGLTPVQPLVSSNAGALGKKDTYTWTTAIESRLHSLANEINRFKNGAKDSTLTAGDVQKVEQLFKQYSQLKSEIERQASKDSISGRRKFQLSGNQVHQSFIKDLNLMINGIKSARLIELQGYLGEYIPAITQYVLENYTKMNTAQLLNNFASNIKVIGNQRTTRLLDPSKFVGGSNFTNAFDVGGINVKAQGKQDKIDLILNIPNGQQINVSAKNVNLKSPFGINILSGSSLLKMLQDYPTFANHYANITAKHTASDDSRPTADILSKAHNAMRMTIGAYALAGGMYGADKNNNFIGHSKKAEILLINDNSTGRFKVYFISDIISKLINNIELLDIEGYNNPSWSNNWVVSDRGGKDVNAGFRRSMKVVAQMHNVKMKVSLSKDALR